MRLRTLLVLLGSIAVAVAGRAMTADAYVWQRQFGPEAAASMTQFAPQLHAYCVLAAEVSWPAGKMAVAPVELDFAALVKPQRPIGLALRIGSSPRPVSGEAEDITALVKLAADTLKRARAGGLTAAELQVDFDCPESKLSGYQGLLEAIRTAIAPTPLVFTALPAWLKHREFAALVQAADSFVLQVHSLEKPIAFEQAFTLCDPIRALAWIEQADQIGVPFRVALPTHGYLLGFDAVGNYLGLAAEGPRPTWPAGSKTRVVRSDPASLLSLQRSMADASLKNCTGVIWFRLPIMGERYGWSAKTFRAVLEQRMPVAKYALEVSWPQPGLAEISLINAGETNGDLPTRVELTLPAGEKVLASDGLGGFRLEMRGSEVQAIARAANAPVDLALAPGRRMKIAWLRFAHDLPLRASLPAP